MKISVRKYAVQELRLQMITVSQSEVTILGRYYRKSKHRYFIIPLHNAEEAPPLKGMSEEEIEAHILGVVMIEHYSMKKSIDLFSNQAKTAVTKELTKINNINTYEPKHAHELTFQESKDALPLLLFNHRKKGQHNQGNIGRRWFKAEIV